MVDINNIQKPSILPAIVDRVLLEYCSHCAICKEELEVASIVNVYYRMETVEYVFHRAECDMEFKKQFIMKHPAISKMRICTILGIRNTAYYRIKQNGK